MREYAGPLLESATLFDVFEGEALGAGRRGLTYRLAFRARTGRWATPSW